MKKTYRAKVKAPCNDSSTVEPLLVIIVELHVTNGALILMEMILTVVGDDDDDERKRKYETERSTCGNGDTGAGSFLSVFDRHNTMQRLFVHNCIKVM